MKNHTALTVTVNSPSSRLMAASGRNSDDVNKKASIGIVLACSDVGHNMDCNICAEGIFISVRRPETLINRLHVFVSFSR